MSRLFVGNLDIDFTEIPLKSFVRGLGIEVRDVQIVRDRWTRTSLGFGFVELAEGVDVEEAISLLDNQHVEGRELRVRRAQDHSTTYSW